MKRFSFFIAFFLSVQIYASSSGTADGPIVLNTGHYTVQAGLVANEVNSIVQDGNGFMWFATTNGLSRFDGYEFRNFRASYLHPDFFRGNMITNLAEKGEEIWFVTPKGLEIFNQKTATSEYVDNDLLADANLKDILFLNNGKVLLGGTTGVFLFDRNTGDVVRLGDPVGNARKRLTNVRDLYMDKHGNVWIGTWRRGLYFILNGSMEIHRLKHEDLPADMTVTSFTETDDGSLVFGTWDSGIVGIRNFFQGCMEVHKVAFGEKSPQSIEWNIVYDVDVDHDGNIWCGSPGGIRVMRLEEDGFRMKEIVYDKGSEITSFHEVKSVYCDNEGTVWLSDYGNGVVPARSLSKLVTEIDLRDKGLKFSSVSAIYEDSRGVCWLGVRGLGVVRYDTGKGIIMKPDRLFGDIDGESNAVVEFVEIPGKNLLFMAMRYYGVYMLKFDTVGNAISISHFDVANGIRNPFINALLDDRKGNIWVATQNGIVILHDDGNGYSVYEPEDINRIAGSSSVTSLCLDSDGNVWAGTFGDGLMKFTYDAGKMSLKEGSVYNVKNGRVNNNDIRCIYMDSSERLWAGSKGGGLLLYDKERDIFSPVENMQLFQSDEILSIVEDSVSNLWLATGNGFICYSQGNGNDRITNYGAGCGLSNLSFIQNSVWTDGKKIIFGGYNGLSIFYPEDILTDVPVAAPKITDIQIYNNSIGNLSKEKRDEFIAMMPPFTEKIKLGSRDKSISITFASPCYGNNSIMRYAYKLEGLDKNWNYVSSNGRTVTYSNLRPGDYVFSVKATNLSGLWTEPSRMSIKVCPAPWFTMWAILGYIAILVVIAYFSIKSMRNRIILRQALEIEQIERLKSEEVSNAKLMFFTNVSHELFTPMTIMKVSLEQLMASGEGDLRLHRLIRSNLNRLMRLLQQIMEFRKAESSNLKLKVSETDIVAFVKKICDDNFAPYVSGRNISLVLSSDSERLDGFIDKDKLDKILYNLLSNAYKYNRKDGSVFVKISSGSDGGKRIVSLSVKDTGFGIAPEKQANLFKRFYEGDYRKFNTTGVGIGLSLTKDLVNLHNGTIKVESIEGEGTEFTVTIPIDKNAYREEQIDIGVVMPSAYVPEKEAEVSPAVTDETKKDHTLLVVEDNEELLYVMRDMFLSRYNVFTALNGNDALEILRDKDVDMVVTDFVMPGMDGAEFCREIRSDISISHIPVIMLSAKASAESKLESYGAGVDAYVEKPFDPKLLIAQVDGLIAGRKRLSENFRSGQAADTEILISTDLDRQFINKVVRLIEEHISDPEFNMTEFNSAMNMSNSTLYRKIKGLTGMSPKEFVRNIRFKYACKLLLEKSSNVTDVAYMCGFTDAKYFSMMFKREFGMTPSRYISQNRKETQVDLQE